MRGVGADDDYIRRIEGAARAVGMEHRDLWPRLERKASAGRKTVFNFNRCNFAVGAGELSQDGRVVAGAASEVENLFSGLNAKRFQVNCPETGLTIVEVLRFVENNECIVVDA
jgi:hypothetical protein